jgi:cell wall-associated NlpC family hydrolase
MSDVDRQISAASQRLETLIERYNAVRDDLQATRSRLASTRSRFGQLNERLDGERDRIRAVAVWAYKTGPASEASAILGATSPASLIERLSTIKAMARIQHAKVRSLTALGRQLVADQGSLQVLADQQAGQQSELSTLTSHVERDLVGLRALRARVARASRSIPADGAPPQRANAGHGAVARVVAFAYAQLGRPYRYGAAGPGSFDCSGLTMAAWRAAGTELPHNAARQFDVVPHVSRANLHPGDLVFYYWDIHHVALYVGRGWVIHAPSPGEAVKLQRLDLAPIHGYGRPS